MQMLDPIEPPSKVRPDLAIPPELETVIMTALAKKREQRYQTMGQLLDALERVLTQVGHSITGSPVYALAPLPPGADPHVVPSLPAAPLVAPVAAERPIARSKSPTNQRHEPQFTTGDKPVTFEHVFADADAPVRRRGWPLVLLFLLILGGAAGALALVITSRNRSQDAATRDAAVIATPPVDAMRVAELADAPEPDAAAPADADVADAPDIVVVRVDAGVRVHVPTGRRDAGVAISPFPDTPTGRGTYMIQVLTKPEGANLYVGTSYRGPGGTQLEERVGTKLEVQCRQPGYKPGKVQLVFDGRREVELCVLERIKICIEGVKNPFDDCQEPATTP